VFVLAIDTSSPAVTAAIVTAEGETVASRAPVAPRGHDEQLAPAVAECLAAVDLTPDRLGAVVAGLGPGPYTGLRVGLVTAAAIGYSLAIPTYGVCSLDGIGATSAEPALLVVTDARRREVYWARYAEGTRIDGPGVARPADLPPGVGSIAGAAADLYPDAWPELFRSGPAYPDPAALVRAAAERISRQDPGDQLTPMYLRRPDAVVPGAPKAVLQ
jgi:tRNA threonylcarbamoyl adenosine modification protein YeaZ